jgi:hypothetical protein
MRERTSKRSEAEALGFYFRMKCENVPLVSLREQASGGM